VNPGQGPGFRTPSGAGCPVTGPCPPTDIGLTAEASRGLCGGNLAVTESLRPIKFLPAKARVAERAGTWRWVGRSEGRRARSRAAARRPPERRRKPQWRLNDSVFSRGFGFKCAVAVISSMHIRYGPADPPIQYPAYYATLEGQTVKQRGVAALRHRNRGLSV